MAAIPSLEFWCIIEGESDIFDVPISANARISQLKLAIQSVKGVEKGSLAGIPFSELHLFKFDNPIPISPVKNLTERVKSASASEIDEPHELETINR
ncbi:hypothetical protein BD410DRAFT_259173 [Rickenella mellea]|uniref:Crinkler effector protein N-terminal domain-containing protein n=1 Tax=Rickenella mellea TaxID=50990 RepID=A0A4Y7Q6D1_9AGAM|nr:hypothetical protein BD410DRAFT_259173 [Rickenella mellea]